tara:strand:- start:12810 stop:14009 length:1200 start_codon:yes stop_codon:yes gene_type:complete
MENIIDPTDTFNYELINLDNPTPVQGGCFFTKLNCGEKKLPLYLQLPKCRSKQGICKTTSSKKFFIDLIFNSYENNLITWFENFENRCRELIFEKKDNWFQSEMDLDDIESHFNSCMKTYKSGKYIVIRCYIPNNKTIKKNYCLIYDENQNILNIEDVKENLEIIPLIAIEGIKFSSKSFQIEINVPQIMVLKMPEEIKSGFLINKKTKNNDSGETIDNKEEVDEKKQELSIDNENTLEEVIDLEKNIDNQDLEIVNDLKVTDNTEEIENLDKVENTNESNKLDNSSEIEETGELNIVDANIDNIELENENSLKELDISLENDITLENDDENPITLKKPNDVYLEIYKNARERAKKMRQAAVEAYLEAKNIKNKYLLDDILSEDENSNFGENEEIEDIE